MPFCPSCESEYIEGTLRCEDCEVELVEELPDTDEQERVVEDDVEFVHLRAYSTSIQAEMVAEALENAGIPTMVRSNEMFGSGTGLGTIAPPRVEIMVPDDRISEAEEIADHIMDSMDA